MIKFRKAYNLKIVFLMVSVLFLSNSSIAYSTETLRLPSFSQNEENRIRSQKILDFTSPEEDHSKDKILVERIDVVDTRTNEKMPKGQVPMRVCEISELSDGERHLVLQALNNWSAVEHPSDMGVMKYDIEYPPSEEKKNRWCYLAISYPDVNGKDEIDVEGFIVVDNYKDGDMYRRRLSCWEIKPENRTKVPRFKGLGDQLFYSVIRRELDDGYDSLTLRIHAPKKFEKWGLKTGINSRQKLEAFITKITQQTLGYIEEYSEEIGLSVEEALKQLELNHEASLSTYI